MCLFSFVADVSLQLCLSHTLRTFRNEVTCEKMLVSGSERDKCLAILKDMAHSSNEAMYNLNMNRLAAVGCARVLDYAWSSWHDIRSQWVEGLKEQHLTLGETTLQRMESVSVKMKSVCCEIASLQQFFMEFRTFLTSMRNGRTHHAMMMLTRKPTTAMADDLLPYRDCLTPYAFRMVQQQHTESLSLGTCSEVDQDVDTFLFESAAGTDTTRLGCCSCRIYTSRRLPCKHLLYVHRLRDAEFDESIFDSRWKRADYLENCQLNLTDGSGTDFELLDMKCDEELSGDTRKQKVGQRSAEQAEKHRKARHMTDQLASLCSKPAMTVFSSRIRLLQKLYDYWSRGIEATLVKLESEEDVSGSIRRRGRAPKRHLKTQITQPEWKRLKTVGRPKGSTKVMSQRKYRRSSTADDNDDVEALADGEQPATSDDVDSELLLAMAVDNDTYLSANDDEYVEEADDFDQSPSEDLATIDANTITDITDCIAGDNGSYVIVPENSELLTEVVRDGAASGIELPAVGAVSGVRMPLPSTRKRGRPKKH